MKTLTVALLSVLVVAACDKPAAEIKAAPSSSAGTTGVVSSPDPAGKKEPMPNVPMPEKSDAARAAASSNTFGLALYGNLAKKQGNLAMSPLSITTALAMTWVGARGDTEKEMRTVLHFSGDGDAAALGKLSMALTSPGRPLTLTIANRLFGEKSFTFQRPFLDTTKATFGAPLEPADFKGAADASRLHINAWVEEKTEHRIKDLLPPRSLTEDTRMVLVNAIYFLADWQTPFKKEATYPEAFKVAGGAEKKVPTMHLGKACAMLQADSAKILSLPYKDADTAMLIALPDAADGISALEAKLTGAKMDDWQKALATAQLSQVDIALPSFKIEPGPPVTLAEPLKAMGMPLSFDVEKADFTGIGIPPNPRNRLYIAEIFHKAFVKVDEKGTEAAAATAVVMAEGGGMPPKAVPFKADHPFLFFVVNKSSGAVLFMGRVADPS